MALPSLLTNILTGDVGFADQAFDLVDRQEFGSRTQVGATLAKEFGSGLWLASYTTEALLNSDAVTYDALLCALNGAIGKFEAFDVRRPGPLINAGGTASNGQLAAVNANTKAVALSGLTPGQVVSVGDYLSWTYGTNRALHRAQEPAVANEDGLTPQFEVHPHIRQGFELGSAVNLLAPRGIFKLVPGSKKTPMQGSKRGIISFQAGQWIE